MSALTDPLNDAQLTLLKVMAEPYLKSGQWPVWRYVDQMMDHLGHDAAERVLKSLPMVGSTGPIGSSYGLTWYDRAHLADDSRPALTAAAGLHVPELAPFFGDTFIAVVQFFTDRQRAVKPSPDHFEDVYITSADFRRDFPTVTDEFMAALPGIFEHEPVLRRGYRHWGTNDWQFLLHKWLREYRDIHHLRGYVERVAKVTTASHTIMVPFPDGAQYVSLPKMTVEKRDMVISGGSSVWGGLSITGQSVTGKALAPLPAVTSAIVSRPASPPKAPPQYVNEALIKELEAKQGHTRLSPDKLSQLLRELNACFRGEHPYACHALLRAIIDHVPPILGCHTFEQIVSNYAWTRTDKKYMQRLLDFKVQADDVLHRHIRPSRDVITMHDLPNSGYINALLRECIDKL